MGLNRRQIKAIALALERYDRFLEAFEPLVERWSSLRSAGPAISELRDAFFQARRAVEEAAASLQVGPAGSDPRMWALAQLTSLWSTLEDLAPPKLRRYGEVDEAAARQWEQLLAQLRLATERLMVLLQKVDPEAPKG